LEIVDRYREQIHLRNIPPSDRPHFDRHLVAIPEVLATDTFRLIYESLHASTDAVRIRLPGHKSGATISYQSCHTVIPGVIALYHSPALRQLISAIVDVSVVPTPLHDQSSCSILIYDQAGDHIGWHHDLNFYAGRHFTALLPLANEDASGEGLSSATLRVRLGRDECEVPTYPNTLVLFEGAHVLHKVTPLGAGEKRIILSMTFCTDPASTALQSTARRFKDIAYYGLKALWT